MHCVGAILGAIDGSMHSYACEDVGGDCENLIGVIGVLSASSYLQSFMDNSRRGQGRAAASKRVVPVCYWPVLVFPGMGYVPTALDRGRLGLYPSVTAVCYCSEL